MLTNSMELRELAVSLFDSGFGYKAVAKRIGAPRFTVRRWLYTYRALGKEALLVRERRNYSVEEKVAVARDVLENGTSIPDAMRRHGVKAETQVRTWCRLYAEGGEAALLPKKRGRRPKPEKPAFATREEELEARVRELELELEIQKRINALLDGIEQRRQRP